MEIGTLQAARQKLLASARATSSNTPGRRLRSLHFRGTATASLAWLLQARLLASLFSRGAKDLLYCMVVWWAQGQRCTLDSLCPQCKKDRRAFKCQMAEFLVHLTYQVSSHLGSSGQMFICTGRAANLVAGIQEYCNAQSSSRYVAFVMQV